MGTGAACLLAYSDAASSGSTGVFGGAKRGVWLGGPGLGRLASGMLDPTGPQESQKRPIIMKIRYLEKQ